MKLESFITVRARVAWWVRPYLEWLQFVTWATGHRFDTAKVAQRLLRNTKIEILEA